MKKVALGMSLLLASTLLAQPANPPAAFRLKPGDGIKVVVLGFPEYMADYFVLSDGTISGIGFGQVRAAGRTVPELEKEIGLRLQAYVKNPRVAVVVTQERQESVFVVRGDGDAATSTTSGGYPFAPGLELRQLIALSKMPSPLDLFETRIYRSGKFLQEVNLDLLMKGDTKQWNGPMQPGDLVTIMPVQMVRIWVLGLVGNPGEKRVRLGSDLYQAIASAGAITAEPSQFSNLEVTVRRGPEIHTFAPRQDLGKSPFLLENGDTIVIQPPTLFRTSVSGFVMKPGDYDVRPGTTIAQLVGAAAGGVGPEGTLKGVYIFRRSEILVVDATAEANQSAPIKVEQGDSVFVLRNERTFTVLGEVLKPGAVMMQDEKEYRLADVLAAGGGLTEKGSLRRAYVLKPENGKLVARQYNLDEYLKDGKAEANPKINPGDVILFGQPKGLTAQNITQALSGVLVFQNLFR